MIGNILLGIWLILWGLVTCLHLPVAAVFLGILAVVTGILLLAGR
jgi:hypothetical protein